VNKNSAPQSMHFSILSWNSIEDVSPFAPDCTPRRGGQVHRRTQECAEACFIPSLKLRNNPWIRPRHTQGCGLLPGRRFVAECIGNVPPRTQRAKKKGAALASGGPPALLLFLSSFLPAALACQRFLDTLLFAGLQIKRVALHFLDDVFLLHLPLEAAQCVFEGLSLLQSDFCQKLHPQTSPDGLDSYCKVRQTSQDLCRRVHSVQSGLWTYHSVRKWFSTLIEFVSEEKNLWPGTGWWEFESARGNSSSQAGCRFSRNRRCWFQARLL